MHSDTGNSVDAGHFSDIHDDHKFDSEVQCKFDACKFVLADHNTTSTADYDFDYSFLTLFLHALLRSPPWKSGIQSRSRQVYADLFHYTVLTIQPRPTSDRPSSERPRNDSASFKNAMTPKVNSRDATLLRASLRVTLPSHAPKRRS